VATYLVEGWTERIIDQLIADDVAVNLTGGTTVELVLYDKNGTLKSIPSQSGIDTALVGKVYYDPASTDLKHSESPYSVRWKVTDVANKVAFFPNAQPEKWFVFKP
jgi:hypothetical protein